MSSGTGMMSGRCGKVKSRRGLGLRRGVLSRMSVPPRGVSLLALRPRQEEGELFGQREREGKGGELGERVLKGAVSMTLALTQVLSSANANALQRAETIQSGEEGQTAAELATTLRSGEEAKSAFASSSQFAPSISAEGEHAPDLYRDTFVRYAGYANEVGESFKNIVSKTTYRASYAVAIMYVIADATDKGIKAEAIAATGSGQASGEAAKSPEVEAAKAAVDTLIWQSLASVIIPGYTINRIVWLAKKLTDSFDGKLPAPAKKWAPTLVGLSVIPLIVHPIDEGVTKLLDLTIRNLY
ncbi:mitochondrial fission process protein [Chloropicon primus]|uniref:Mitochondrial fission process protein 1 n=1 Tax=Chloropicon primus TaxID=1764295 RepID=A0A5B8MU25_9CHLO|nr:mitochondrial fission process protein [Chloropicon primus]UPR02166.1 mitochondrial fission process protein [Chloropicon primus]|eukprot:QDZ22942.1 mitochondrial fission process protein [Chloropicon primus]